MKDLFPQYDQIKTDALENIWENATFVFDANILLNLYRYHNKTRDELLEVLNKISDRLWIPYQVALEFHRNRNYVIAEQNKRFQDVRNIINSTKSNLRNELGNLQLENRHSLIDPSPVIEGFDGVVEKFFAALDKIEQKQQKVGKADPLKSNIEKLFTNHVGPGPKDQTAIDQLYNEAEKRFKLGIPPGYKDANKNTDDTYDLSVGGINYKRKYGDFIVWKQLLDYAKSNKVRTLIFVTDDSKEDWWWKIKADKPMTVGPRPELIEEAHRVSGIDSFHMFKTESFLYHSNKFLKAKISSETFEEVRELYKFRSQKDKLHRKLRDEHLFAEQSVSIWLKQQYGAITRRNGFPDFIVTEDGNEIGFEIRTIRSEVLLFQRYAEVIRHAEQTVKNSTVSLLTIIWIAKSKSHALKLQSQIQNISSSTNIGRKIAGYSGFVNNLVGFVREYNDGEAIFCPIE